jgi:hypothetical protein
MACPPGTVLNPQTLRCVKVTGRKARELLKADIIGAANIGDVGYYYVPQPVPRARTTMRLPYREAPIAAAFGVKVPRYERANVGVVPILEQPLPPCPPGTERNPMTRRCIKIGGRTYKRAYPPAPPPPQVPVLRPMVAPAFAPVAAPAAPQEHRRLSAGPANLPVGSASVAPMADKPMILGWASGNCDNDRDPITGASFASADTATLQELIRLHTRTCVLARPLHVKVSAEHKAGKIATIPGDATSAMTLDDFKALRDAMRRRDPGYKIPGRRHQPPPPEWKLYLASDNRSGPEFVSVMYVDTTKVVRTAYGLEYPPASVMIDMGFIPVSIPGRALLCSPSTLVEIIKKLSESNRLLAAVAGGWKPVAGFPFTKKYWETDRANKFNRLCKELTRTLTLPF